MLGSGETLGSILRQIGRMAVIVGALGLALYGGIALIAQWPHGHLFLGLALALPLTLMTAWQVAEAWHTGEFPVWLGDVVRRAEQPRAYWLAMAWYGTCALGAFALAATIGWRLALALGLDLAAG